MKLYATITSERATKSQGGNEYLSGKFTIDEKEVLSVSLDSHNFIYIKDGKGKEIVVLMYNDKNGEIDDIAHAGEITKGKRQKGESLCKHGKPQGWCCDWVD